ncbi:MAG TPA: FlgD immunoglobulin-like domain containing protein, partial [Candidatus Krumholzibacteria bacterium]|nr:FlgD immunoglobulin-like domain containing protein [Candidatus Krumholzibacteria bacterium]
DVVLYQVYRATSQVPEPTEDYLVHTTSGTEWVDPSPEQGSVYAVIALDESGNASEPATQGSATGVGDRIPARVFLSQNAPNPFNPSTTIEFGVGAGGGHVRLEVFDVTGARVRTLLNEQRPGGVWQTRWDGRSDAGSRVSSGVYFYRLRVGSDEQTRRMTLLE